MSRMITGRDELHFPLLDISILLYVVLQPLFQISLVSLHTKIGSGYLTECLSLNSILGIMRSDIRIATSQHIL